MDNQFEYNVDDQVWQFNLKVKNYTASGTYTINMKSGDEEEYLVYNLFIGRIKQDYRI